MSSRTHEVVVKQFIGTKTKDMKSHIIPTVEQNPDNIILQIGTNYFKTIDTPEKITMGVLNLAMTCKTDTNSIFFIWHCPKI